MLFARGKAEEETQAITHNNEWILCIVNFDLENVAEERRAVSGLLMKQLVEKLNTISYRSRIEKEYAYYQDAALAKNRSEKSKALAAKQEERSMLLYEGEPDWRYKSIISRIDREIEKLKAEMEETKDEIPVIEREPIFSLTGGNLEMQFPDFPGEGNEYRFCNSQKTDAMLTGTISDFHGRFIVNLKLYAVYSRSYIWEDRIIFSHEDIDSALEEFSLKLVNVISANKPSYLAVETNPPDALVLINRSFAARGESSILEMPPGNITITASASGYESLSFDTELVSGELSGIKINLNPIEYMDLDVTGNTKGLSGSIYLGSLYVGEAPLTLRLPLNRMEYIEIETETGEAGRIIYQTKDTNDSYDELALRTGIPPVEGRVDRARRMFYWSLGATWVSGITGWLSYYSYYSMAVAYNYSKGTDQKLYDDANRRYNLYLGSIITLGALAVLDVILIIRYVYIANKGSASVKTGRN